MTCLELITDSLRLIGVIRSTEVPTAEMGQSGLRALNDMVFDWEQDGIRIGWYLLTSVNDELPVQPENHRGLRFNLALELCGQFGVDPVPRVSEVAQISLDRLKKSSLQSFQADLSDLPMGSPWGSSISMSEG